MNANDRDIQTSSDGTELFPQRPLPRCMASIIVPARNEEDGLPATLDALRRQVDLHGRPLDPDSYEVLLLLNNCTDRSAEVARKYRDRTPDFQLLIAEAVLPADEAHVGTARRMLMDAACERMEGQEAALTAILSTDADTLVAPDWLAANLLELEGGAEVVGGVIDLLPEDLRSLQSGTRVCYQRDRRYQALVAELESLLDPDPADPWPRHLEHFGASLACTCEVYRRCGGLPAVKPLEDVAFIDALRKVGARIRHSPRVRIHTSARLDGRAEVGLSGQLRHWQEESARALPHVVDSAAWLEHRFSRLAALREANAQDHAPNDWPLPPHWADRLQEAHALRLPAARFLEVLDCNGLIEETFTGPQRHEEISTAIRKLERAIKRRRAAPARPADSAHAADAQLVSTPGD